MEYFGSPQMNTKVTMLDNRCRKICHYFVFSTNGFRTAGYPFENKKLNSNLNLALNTKLIQTGSQIEA